MNQSSSSTENQSFSDELLKCPHSSCLLAHVNMKSLSSSNNPTVNFWGNNFPAASALHNTITTIEDATIRRRLHDELIDTSFTRFAAATANISTRNSLVRSLYDAARSKETVDLHEILLKSTLATISAIAVGPIPAFLEPNYKRFSDNFLETITTPFGTKQEKVTEVEKFVGIIIYKALADEANGVGKGNRQHLLGRLIQSREVNDRTTLQDMIMTFLVTATGMISTATERSLRLVLDNGDVKIAKEVEGMEKCVNKYAFDCLDYVEAYVYETLKILDPQEPKEKKKEEEEKEKFLPERWLDRHGWFVEGDQGRAPFVKGGRVCLGKELVCVVVKVVLVAVLSRFRLTREGKAKEGLPVRVVKRPKKEGEEGKQCEG